MEIPVIDFKAINSEKRAETMALLHQACEKSGFFMVENHEIDGSLVEKVKQLFNKHYEENLKESFYKSEIAKSLEKQHNTADIDWESAFLIRHRPNSNINEIPNHTIQIVDDYITQKVAEKLSELISENLGLENDYIKKAFSGSKGPTVGTKVAIYPQCTQPESVRGLREHTDAGGTILMLQDDKVPGLEFLKDGKWVKIPPSKNNAICVKTRDQLEVLSNGFYKSFVHRVMLDERKQALHFHLQQSSSRSHHFSSS